MTLYTLDELKQRAKLKTDAQQVLARYTQLTSIIDSTPARVDHLQVDTDRDRARLSRLAEAVDRLQGVGCDQLQRESQSLTVAIDARVRSIEDLHRRATEAREERQALVKEA